MAIKAVTPNWSLVLCFGLGFLSIFRVFIVILSLELFLLSLDTSELIASTFLLQDFFKLLSCIAFELVLLLNSNLFCWIALFGLG